MVAKYVNKKNAGKRVLAINALLYYTHMLLLLQPSVLWLSIVTFNYDAKPQPNEFCDVLMYSESDPG